jgi:hypothetical protein
MHWMCNGSWGWCMESKKMKYRMGLSFLAILLVVLFVWPPFQSGARAVFQSLVGDEMFISDPFSPSMGEAAFDGAIYYVDQNHPMASDSNVGSENEPWQTIQHAADVMQAGDTVNVAAGIYEEQVQAMNSGQLGNPITYKVEDEAIVRGFRIEDESYIRIIGFEITHQGSDFQNEGIRLVRANGIEILDNYIHHVYTLGIWMYHSGFSHDAVIRGNRMEFIGAVEGHEAGEIAIKIWGNNNLVEYNDISHVGDFLNVWGEKNIIRNNYFHDNYLSDFPECPLAEGHHIDGLQNWSDERILLTRTLMENNLFVDSTVPHAHTVLIRDIENTGSSEFLYRNNVDVRTGSYPFGVEQFENARFIHNTLVDVLSAQSPKAWYGVSFLDYSNEGHVINNIFYNSARDGGRVYYVDPESQARFEGDYNLAYNSGCGSACSWLDPIRSEENGILNQDPLFENHSEDNFRLQPNSPAVDSASPLTTTISSGTGTQIVVQDAGFFVDGWGRGLGDLIRVGTNTPVRITSIDYGNNTITVDRGISWNSGDGVGYAYQGSNPDRGAYEYGTSKDFDIHITSPSNGGSVSGRVQVQLDVINKDAVRYVVFLVDGIPVAISHDSPYAIEWDTIGLPSRAYTIEARAYARQAASTLWQSDQMTVTVLPYQEYPRGDVNRDWEVTVLDIEACAGHILGRQDWGEAADVNGDGEVDVLDVQEIVKLMYGG